jgi:hypothetical protein
MLKIYENHLDEICSPALVLMIKHDIMRNINLNFFRDVKTQKYDQFDTVLDFKD